MGEERFFYHSFPRRCAGDPMERGLAILKGVLERGLLLTPEQFEFRESLVGGSLSKPYRVAQKRACFTELAPRELSEHSKCFGEFAFEWDVAQLRKIGAIPVFYVPMTSKGATLEGVGASFLARLYETQELLVRLEKLSEVVSHNTNQHELINVTRNNQLESVTRCTVGGALDLLRYLQLELQPVQALTSALRAIAGHFYPTENLSYTNELAYYRQREWRIVANLIWEGRPITTACSDSEIAELLTLDSEFFGKEIELPTGRDVVARQCHLFREFSGQPFHKTIRRIVAPKAAVPQIRQILAGKSVETVVIAQEALTA